MILSGQRRHKPANGGEGLEWLDVQPTDRVLDLFCGMGNFTLPLALRAASVVGVEGVEALVVKGGKRRAERLAKCDILSSKS